LLKGLGDLYNSQHFLEQWLKVIPEGNRSEVREKIFFTQATLPFDEVNKLYNIADCYVAPYRAEGFNLPVLEAAGCGLCSIISAHGSTEDFTNEGFVRYIATRKVDSPERVSLEPEVQSLIRQMMAVRNDSNFRREAGELGPSYVREDFTWELVVDQLLGKLREMV
jgi:glycosyltransferase involved in cell wall biosynthesis